MTSILYITLTSVFSFNKRFLSSFCPIMLELSLFNQPFYKLLIRNYSVCFNLLVCDDMCLVIKLNVFNLFKFFFILGVE